MARRIQLRRDTAAAWTAANPTLAQGEVGVDLTNNKIKLGNGTTAWNSLNYWNDNEPSGFDGTYASLTGKPDLSKLINGNKTVSLGANGTLTVPSPTSPVFTLTFAESNYVPTISKPTLTLTDTPWELHGQYAYTTDGRVAPLALDNIFPVLINPGYTSGDAFTFDESIHGFSGYTLTVTLTDVVLPGGAGWTANIEMNDPPEYPSTVKSLGAIKLVSDEASWIFGTDGELTVPGAIFKDGGLYMNSSGSTTAASVFVNGFGGSVILRTADNANNVSHDLVFDVNGNLTVPGNVSYPGGITQSQQDNTQCLPNVDTVVYTATGTDQHAIKLFVMVEGLTDGGGLSWDTQACDVIAVKGFNNNVVHVTTYGVTYTGAGAIATFDGQWNTLTNRIEITCRPAGSINSVVASVHAIEMTTND